MAPRLFRPFANTTGFLVRLIGRLPESAAAHHEAIEKQLEAQRDFLESSLGLVTSWLGRQFRGDPAQWGRQERWEEPMSYLASDFFPRSSSVVNRTFMVMGGQWPIEVLRMIAPHVTDVRSVDLAPMLRTLAQQVGQGLESSDTVHTHHLVISHRPTRDGEGWRLASEANYYLLAFNRDSRAVLDNCGLPFLIPWTCSIARGTCILDSGAFATQSGQRARWQQLLDQAPVDELSAAENKFEAQWTVRG